MLCFPMISEVLATLLLAGADPQHQSLIGSLPSDLCASEAGLIRVDQCPHRSQQPSLSDLSKYTLYMLYKDVYHYSSF